MHTCVGTRIHIYTVLCSGSGPEKTRKVCEKSLKTLGRGAVCMCACTQFPAVSLPLRVACVPLGGVCPSVVCVCVCT